jgi:thioredoxin-like negative regulator of GroEL
MKTIENAGAFQEVISGEKPTVVMFKAAWCPDCTFLTPFIDEVAEKYSADLDFYQIEMDDVEQPFADHAVMGIPSFITFKNGQEILRFVSKYRKTREEIEDYLTKAAEKAQGAA